MYKCKCLVRTSYESYRAFSSSSVQLVRKKASHPRLPVPARTAPLVDVPSDHGLWGFFRADRKTLTAPREDAKHGRAWSAEELRRKSFDDLHALWIICLKERNILSTQRHERRRQQIVGSGNEEASTRDRTVKRTMAGIKFVLNERLLAYKEAKTYETSEVTQAPVIEEGIETAAKNV